MEKKRSLQIRMDFDGSKPYISSALMGIAFFLRTVYYLGFTRPEQLGFWSLLIFLILPMMLEAAFMVLLRGAQLNAPGIYGIFGAAYCFVLILQGFQYDSILRMLLAIGAYLLCGGALLAVVAGQLNKKLAAVVCFLTAAVRLLAFDFGYYILGLRLISFMPEAAAICAVMALGFLSLGVKLRRRG